MGSESLGLYHQATRGPFFFHPCDIASVGLLLSTGEVFTPNIPFSLRHDTLALFHNIKNHFDSCSCNASESMGKEILETTPIINPSLELPEPREGIMLTNFNDRGWDNNNNTMTNREMMMERGTREQEQYGRPMRGEYGYPMRGESAIMPYGSPQLRMAAENIVLGVETTLYGMHMDYKEIPRRNPEHRTYASSHLKSVVMESKLKLEKLPPVSNRSIIYGIKDAAIHINKDPKMTRMDMTHTTNLSFRFNDNENESPVTRSKFNGVFNISLDAANCGWFIGYGPDNVIIFLKSDCTSISHLAVVLLNTSHNIRYTNYSLAHINVKELLAKYTISAVEVKKSYAQLEAIHSELMSIENSPVRNQMLEDRVMMEYNKVSKHLMEAMKNLKESYLLYWAWVAFRYEDDVESYNSSRDIDMITDNLEQVSLIGKGLSLKNEDYLSKPMAIAGMYGGRPSILIGPKADGTSSGRKKHKRKSKKGKRHRSRSRSTSRKSHGRHSRSGSRRRSSKNRGSSRRRSPTNRGSSRRHSSRNNGHRRSHHYDREYDDDRRGRRSSYREPRGRRSEGRRSSRHRSSSPGRYGRHNHDDFDRGFGLRKARNGAYYGIDEYGRVYYPHLISNPTSYYDDSLGRQVTLYNNPHLYEGSHEITFDHGDDYGRGMFRRSRSASPVVRAYDEEPVLVSEHTDYHTTRDRDGDDRDAEWWRRERNRTSYDPYELGERRSRKKSLRRRLSHGARKVYRNLKRQGKAFREGHRAYNESIRNAPIEVQVK